MKEQVTHWLSWGHRVTVVACGYRGAAAYERDGDLTVHRVGGRTTVFPRACWRLWRGLARDADVALEIFNGIPFMAPVWLRTPRITLIHHVHRDHYVAEMGAKGHAAAVALETVPLRSVYRRSRFITMSQSSAAGIVANGIRDEQVRINTPGLDLPSYAPGAKAAKPTLLYLGRLKRYKRPELTLDILQALPEAELDIAGAGDHRDELQAEIERRGLSHRVRLHGHVDEATKLRLLQSAWVHLMPSSNEGWGLTVMEAAACGTPTVASASGGLRESVVDGHTGFLGSDVDGLITATRRLLEDDSLRARMGEQARQRAEQMSWARHARTTLDEMLVERDRQAHAAARRLPSTRALAAGVAGANVAAIVAATALLSTFQTAAVLGLQGLFLAAFAAVLRRPSAPSSVAVTDRTA